MAKLNLENATIDELRQSLLADSISAAALVEAYLARIEVYDRAGPRLTAIREINPDALTIATAADAAKSARHLPLHGIPILVKDNIATADRQHTTAGSLALADARANRDATVVRLLREAGAIIIGKANLTEFANILAIDMPAGYSSLGGQVRNPYAPQLDDRDIPIVPPGGSSSGSAAAVAAGSRGGGNRHRDLGLAVVAGLPMRARYRQADRRSHQPRRHRPDRAQPGHRGAADPHRW